MYAVANAASLVVCFLTGPACTHPHTSATKGWRCCSEETDEAPGEVSEAQGYTAFVYVCRPFHLSFTLQGGTWTPASGTGLFFPHAGTCCSELVDESPYKLQHYNSLSPSTSSSPPHAVVVAIHLRTWAVIISTKQRESVQLGSFATESPLKVLGSFSLAHSNREGEGEPPLPHQPLLSTSPKVAPLFDSLP